MGGYREWSKAARHHIPLWFLFCMRFLKRITHFTNHQALIFFVLFWVMQGHQKLLADRRTTESRETSAPCWPHATPTQRFGDPKVTKTKLEIRG